MNRETLLIVLGLLAAGTPAAGIEKVHAQTLAQRTWVSGVGDDTAACTRTAPCQTFAGAIAKTAAGGEISVLDPGGFGPVTITQAITIDGGGGQVASILATSGNAITINAGPLDVVVLRNLRITGTRADNFNNSAHVGIAFKSGLTLIVENCEVFGFFVSWISVGTSGGSRLTVINSVLTVNGTAILVNPTGGGANVALTHVVMEQNGGGLVADATAGGWVNVAMLGGSASNNSGIGVRAKAGPQYATVLINQANISHNGSNGIESDQSGGSPASIVAGFSTFDGNSAAAVSTGGGLVGSYGTNLSNGNLADNGTFTPIPLH